MELVAQPGFSVRYSKDKDDLPEVNDYMCHRDSQSFCRVKKVDGTDITLQESNRELEISFYYASTRQRWLLVERSPVPKQLLVHQERIKEALSNKKKYFEKLVLVGNDGEVSVLKSHALLVSDSFEKMVIMAQNNKLKVDLGQKALEFFKDYIHSVSLDASELDAESFAELVDISEMYMIKNFVEVLIEVMNPKMKELSGDDFHPYLKTVARLPAKVSIPLLRAWLPEAEGNPSKKRRLE